MVHEVMKAIPLKDMPDRLVYIIQRGKASPARSCGHILLAMDGVRVVGKIRMGNLYKLNKPT